MLTNLFPKYHQHYSSLPVLGSTLDEFTNFLALWGYPRPTACCHVSATPEIDRRLQQHGCHNISQITRFKLQQISVSDPSSSRKKNIHVHATAKLLERYFDELGIFPPPKLPTAIDEKLICYSSYLQKVRGLAASTIHQHILTISEFLTHFNKPDLSYLSQLTSQNIEDFVRDTGNRVTRGRLQHVISHLRSFLRFFAAHGEVPAGLYEQLDTPRIYQEEQLPRALDWKTVDALLKSIVRSTAIGKRDYAILLLIATYGSRVSEVVDLKLEDIEWRTNRLRIFQRKTGNSLLLPLTEAVGESIIDYLRQGRPLVPYREVFVRHRAPSGILKPTAVSEIFQAWSRRSGLAIPFQGAHCLRHSYAVHLLRQGTAMKTIGDVLGHRSLNSTKVYLRLAIEDLRTVPLCLPISSSSTQGVSS